MLPVGGVYAWRRDGEHHMWNPETIALVQHAVRSANGDVKAAPSHSCNAGMPLSSYTPVDARSLIDTRPITISSG